MKRFFGRLAFSLILFQISAHAEKPIFGSGTGFFLTADGVVATNWHVVEDADQIFVQTNQNQEIEAQVISKYPDMDLALLRVSEDLETTYLPLGDSNECKLGQPVYTIGFPNPIIQGFNPKFTSGEINSLSGTFDMESLFQISVPLQPGNSGGALVTNKGQVVGMVASKLRDGENVAYAIKSRKISALVELTEGLAPVLETQDNTPAANREEAIQRAQNAAVRITVIQYPEKDTVKTIPDSQRTLAGLPQEDEEPIEDSKLGEPDAFYNVQITNQRTGTKFDGKAILWWQKESVFGGYRIDGSEDRYFLRGQLNPDGTIDLVERTNGETSAAGRITMSTVNGKKVWKGTLSNTKDNRRFEFRLTRLKKP